MKLSVVIASPGPKELLEECRNALESQQVEQIIVSQGPGELPSLRWSEIDRLDGDVIACLEGRSIPAPNWAEQVRAAHASGPETIGGIVRPAPGATGFELGQYFSDHFVAAAAAQRAERISDANVSYKRAYVERFRDRLASGEWETALHAEAAARGELALTDARVVYRYEGRTRSQVFSERYRHGRGYAARPEKRRDRILFAPVLPFVLTGRSLRAALGSGLVGSFVRALPWTCALNIAWSVGEAVGGAFGVSTDADRH